jgi:antirestriction protein ArdC
VFNADQVVGLPERFHPAASLDLVEPEGRAAELDSFFAGIPANLRHHGAEAYYEPTPDRVTMPPAHLFAGFDHYYATLAHELSHWTGHPSRLSRNLKNRFGTSAYAAEELIAELSSAILGAELGLPVTHLDSHASYIEHWLKLLRDDDRAILTAAAKAEEAATLLLRLGGRMLADGEAEPGDVALAA